MKHQEDQSHTLRIVVLVENTATRRGLLAEHGLSFWIEIDGRKILFDAGQTRVLASNARRLGVRLASADAVVLSHGHYDHTGGLADVLSTARKLPLYAHPAALELKYARNADGSARVVSMADATRELIAAAADFIPVAEPTEIVPGLHLTGEVPRVTDFEDTGGAFFLDRQCERPDVLPDDQAAFINTPAGLVVILGCAHAGIVNTLKHIQDCTDGRPIHTVIGGTHLVNASADRVGRTIAELRRLNIRRLLPCHCTGQLATARLLAELPDICQPAPVGTVLEFDGPGS